MKTLSYGRRWIDDDIAEVVEFEKTRADYVGERYAVTSANGTDASSRP